MKLLALCVFLIGGTAAHAAPVLYSSPFLQSPVRGGPRDLLILAGADFAVGDRVVYKRMSDSDPLTPPGVPPPLPTPDWGFAPVVSVANVPASIVVKLPGEIVGDATYGLWVLRGSAEWSNGVRLNDARPQWITPPFLYA